MATVTNTRKVSCVEEKVKLLIDLHKGGRGDRIDTFDVVFSVKLHCLFVCLRLARQPPCARTSLFTRFLHHTQRRTTVSRTPLDERSARRRDLYLTTHNTHKRQTSMPPSGIRTRNLSRRAATDLRLRWRDHWGRRETALHM